LHHSRPRPSAGGWHLCPGLSRRAGLHAVHRLPLRGGQPSGRPPLSASRSKGDGMIARAFGLPALRFNGLIGILVVGLLLLVAVFGPWLAPYDPLKLDLMARLKGPSAAHLLGADEFGRDLLSRLIHGARTSA